MKLEILKNAKEVAVRAKEIVGGAITENPELVLGLPTGSTPEGLYRELSASTLDFSRVKTFNLDEYYPMQPTDPQSYRYFMNSHLFNNVNLDMANTHVPDGTAADPDAACAKYEEMIREAGGVDLQVLGVGRNGHIGFNEPGTPFDSPTHKTTLTANTIEANARFFRDKTEVPAHALTMGIGTILRAKKILILITGADKHEALRSLLKGKIDEAWPVTALLKHDDVIVLCDTAAYNKYYIGIDVGGTKIKAGVVSDFGEVLEETSEPTEKSSTEAHLQQIARLIADFAQRYAVTAAGIGLPGVIVSEAGQVVNCCNLPLSGVNIVNELKKRVGVSVRIDNDANCAVMAEREFGAAKDCDNVVMLTIGTGIGSGTILDGKLHRGKNGGGELGHMITHAGGKPCACGQKGCFEQYASASALSRAVKEAAEKNPESILAAKLKGVGPCEAVFAAAEDGCTLSKELLSNYFDELATGLKCVCNAFGPDIIVLSGGITAQGNRFLNEIKSRMNGETEVRLSGLQKRAGIIGAAMLCREDA